MEKNYPSVTGKLTLFSTSTPPCAMESSCTLSFSRFIIVPPFGNQYTHFSNSRFFSAAVFPVISL